MCLLWVLNSHLSNAQHNKEDRNNYPSPQNNPKTTIKVDKVPFVFSPHLSYKEQKQIQMSKKQVGGITFAVKSVKSQPTNYKQPTLRSKNKFQKKSQMVADTSAPYVRYELSDSTDQ
ncbi:MAG TPA: hypothetical protein DCM71_01555 [Runella sp.]|nr:hypothetical protein [Runella sp.]